MRSLDDFPMLVHGMGLAAATARRKREMHLSTGAADPVYFLLHVPRTAGQTIELHLEEHAAPGTVWMPRHLPRRPMLIKPRRHDLSRLGNPRSVRAVVGHDIGCSLERYFE